MPFDASIFANAAILTLGIQYAGFLAAYALQTEVFYDVLGGINFLLLAGYGILERWSTASPRLIAMTTVFCGSRGWLLVFLAYRAHSRKGDSRFDGIKEKFWSFWVYWTAQAAWVFLIAWPLIVVQALDGDSDSDVPQSLSAWDITMIVGFAFGVITEITADVTKTLWVNRGREGTFCTVGLWSFSRHPNYFGEIFQWWCAWGLSYGSLAAISGPSTISILFWVVGVLSPLFSMNILLNMSGTGIWSAEGKSLQRYIESEDGEAYKTYRASTSPLIPMVGYKHIPKWMQRVFLFEWERFEYKPSSDDNKKSEDGDGDAETPRGENYDTMS